MYAAAYSAVNAKYLRKRNMKTRMNKVIRCRKKRTAKEKSINMELKKLQILKLNQRVVKGMLNIWT
jgi:hypothetical protein